MKSLDVLKVLLLLVLVFITGFAVAIFHSQRYQPITAQDKLYLIDKRTGTTYYPAQVQGKVQWQVWVPAMEE